MKTVYQAANALEAHMLQEVLRQQEIPSELQGEHLPGAIGELPAAGLVRLVVEDHEYARAKAAVERWEATEAVATPEVARPSCHKFTAAILGMLVGIAITYALLRVPATQGGNDFNGDGILDERWKFSAGGTWLGTQVDRNFDGKIDYVLHVDERGHPESAEADNDFDTKFETRDFYNLGQIDRSEVDTDKDTVKDLKLFYKHGVLEKAEYINPYTALPARVEHLALGGVVAAEIDSNNDGKLDTRLIYSPLLEVIRSEQIESLP